MSARTWNAVDEVIARHLVPPDEALDAVLDASRAAGLPPHHLSRAQGKLLQMLAAMVDARRVLEIGTLGGYSALWLARGLVPGGTVLTLEANPAYAEVARENVARAGCTGRVEVRVGDATEILDVLVAQGVEPFDVVFIDADKRNNVAYFERALALTRPGSIVVVDNVVRNGALADEESTDPSVLGSRAVIERMGREPRVQATALQTVGEKGYDGFAIARVVDGAPAQAAST